MAFHTQNTQHEERTQREGERRDQGEVFGQTGKLDFLHLPLS